MPDILKEEYLWLEEYDKKEEGTFYAKLENNIKMGSIIPKAGETGGRTKYPINSDNGV